MGRATIDREIARIEAIGRSRALEDCESRQLERMIAIERRYDSTQRLHRERSGRKPTPRVRPTIIQRLDHTIARMVREDLPIRAIYLNAGDIEELLATGAIGGEGPWCYRDTPIRRLRNPANRSVAYSAHGVARGVRRNCA